MSYADSFHAREIHDCRDQIEADYSGRQQDLPELWELEDEPPTDEDE